MTTRQQARLTQRMDRKAQTRQPNKPPKERGWRNMTPKVQKKIVDSLNKQIIRERYNPNALRIIKRNVDFLVKTGMPEHLVQIRGEK